MNNLVTVASYDYPTDSVMAKSLLESAGIECIVKDELITQTAPYLTHSVGGVKLQVKRKDVAAAIEIVDSTGYKRSTGRDEKSDQLEKVLMSTLGFLFIVALFYFWYIN